VTITLPDYMQARLTVLVRNGYADLGDQSSARAVYELLEGLCSEVYRDRLPSAPEATPEPLGRFVVVNEDHPTSHHTLHGWTEHGGQGVCFDANEWDVGTVVEVRRLPSGDAPPASIGDAGRGAELVASGVVRCTGVPVQDHRDVLAYATALAARRAGDAPQEPRSRGDAWRKHAVRRERDLDEMRERYHEAERRASEARSVTTDGEAWVWSDDDTAASIDTLGDRMVVRITGGHLRALMAASRPPGGAEPGLRAAVEGLAASVEASTAGSSVPTSWVVMQLRGILASEGAAPPEQAERPPNHDPRTVAKGTFPVHNGPAGAVYADGEVIPENHGSRILRLASYEKVSPVEIEDSIQLLAARYPVTAEKVLTVIEEHGLADAQAQIEASLRVEA
jgi:hypothetical protein